MYRREVFKTGRRWEDYSGLLCRNQEGWLRYREPEGFPTIPTCGFLVGQTTGALSVELVPQVRARLGTSTVPRPHDDGLRDIKTVVSYRLYGNPKDSSFWRRNKSPEDNWTMSLGDFLMEDTISLNNWMSRTEVRVNRGSSVYSLWPKNPTEEWQGWKGRVVEPGTKGEVTEVRVRPKKIPSGSTGDRRGPNVPETETTEVSLSPERRKL